MNLATAIKLGRVSNLPTVWTNVLAGAVLAGGVPTAAYWPALVVAFSLFYTGGMYLNDYYDRDFDATARPDRPIPSGQAEAGTVAAVGYAMLAVAVVVISIVSLARGTVFAALPAAGALAITIVAYDRHHKNNATGPLLMGLCRMLVYLGTAAVIVGRPGFASIGASVLLLCYLIGLTYAAKRAGPLNGAIAVLIAGISLLDAAFIAATGHLGLAAAAAAGFPATLFLQRFVRGT